MLKATMKYGAIRAKVMAMQGKLLKPADIDRLCECASVTDIVTFLRTHKGWSEVISKITPPITAHRLAAEVSDQVWRESAKLYSFAGGDDKTFLRFSVSRGEYTLILAALRRVSSRASELAVQAPDFIAKNSKLELPALNTSLSWDNILAACGKTIYAPQLKKLPVDGQTGLPNYSDVCVLLENTYYKTLFAYISKKYQGLGKRQLLQLTGREADLLNLVSLMRLQRHFPGSLSKADELLIPVSYQLSPQLTADIAAARSEREAMSLIRESRYGRYFADYGDERLESLYETIMSQFCRKFMSASEPSLATAQAYLTLKEIECKKLLRIIEAVECGVDPHKAL